MPWQQVHVFWADERCVPPDHADSNYRLAFETLLSRVPVPDENVHRIRGEEGPDRAAADYEQELHRFFGPQHAGLRPRPSRRGRRRSYCVALSRTRRSFRNRIRLALPVTPRRSKAQPRDPFPSRAEQCSTSRVSRLRSERRLMSCSRCLTGSREHSFPPAQVLPVHGRLALAARPAMLPGVCEARRAPRRPEGGPSVTDICMLSLMLFRTERR